MIQNHTVNTTTYNVLESYQLCLAFHMRKYVSTYLGRDNAISDQGQSLIVYVQSIFPKHQLQRES